MSYLSWSSIRKADGDVFVEGRGDLRRRLGSGRGAITAGMIVLMFIALVVALVFLWQLSGVVKTGQQRNKAAFDAALDDFDGSQPPSGPTTSP